MGATKVTRQQVAIIGSILIVLTLGLSYYFLIRPLLERETAAQTKYDTNYAVAITRDQAEANKRQALEEVRQATAKWAQYERKYMPNINVSNLIQGMRQRWQEQSVTLGPLITRFLNQDRSVRITQANISVPAPPTDPNAMATNVIVLPIGQVSVLGTFRNVLNHTERWNTFRRLMLVDNLTLAGNSPLLQGQYALTCFIFTQGDPGPAVPSAGGAGGGGGFPGGGYPGGGFGSPGPGGYPGPGGPGGPPGDYPGPGGAVPL